MFFCLCTNNFYDISILPFSDKEAIPIEINVLTRQNKDYIIVDKENFIRILPIFVKKENLQLLSTIRNVLFDLRKLDNMEITEKIFDFHFSDILSTFCLHLYSLRNCVELGFDNELKDIFSYFGFYTYYKQKLTNFNSKFTNSFMSVNRYENFKSETAINEDYFSFKLFLKFMNNTFLNYDNSVYLSEDYKKRFNDLKNIWVK